MIDVGCTPGVAFPALGDVVRELRGAGMRVSVDSFDPAEIRTAVEAGRRAGPERERLQPRGRARAGRLRARASWRSRTSARASTPWRPTLEALERWGVGYLIDPIIEPIGFGFMASLERYAEVHRR